MHAMVMLIQMGILVGILMVPRTLKAMDRSVYDLSLAELGKMRFTTAAALTATEKSMIPASITTNTERFVSMLGDIHNIDVIRGPGSALYGPGAIAGVIDIHTLESLVSAETLDTAELETIKEEEFRHDFTPGDRFSMAWGIFYYGYDALIVQNISCEPYGYGDDFLYNILGWVNRTLNKRNRLIQMGQFRQLAPSLAVSMGYRF